MKRLLIFLLVVLTFTLPLSGCGHSETELTEAYNEGYNAGYAKGYDEGQASAAAAPEGSIIYEDVSLRNKEAEGLYKMEQSVLVQNVGNDGAITVYFELQREGSSGPARQSKKIYLKQGEERRLSFYFITSANENWKRRIWTTP